MTEVKIVVDKELKDKSSTYDSTYALYDSLNRRQYATFELVLRQTTARFRSLETLPDLLPPLPTHPSSSATTDQRGEHAREALFALEKDVARLYAHQRDVSGPQSTLLTGIGIVAQRIEVLLAHALALTHTHSLLHFLTHSLGTRSLLLRTPICTLYH